MLRLGSSLALRFLAKQHAGSSSLLFAASNGSRAAMSEINAAVEAQTCFVNVVQAPVTQFSSSAAAALAQKQAHIRGLGGLRLPTARSFASSAISQAPAATAVAPAAAAASEQQPSMLRRLAKAAAVVIGGLMLAAGTASADSPEPWQWLFQDSATSTAQAMQDLHHDIMFFVISISVLVLYMIGAIATKFHYTKQLKPEKLTHHTTLEVIWTIIPTIIVLSIAVPSLTLIYSLDQHADRPGLTVKVIGRQWYWSYEMHDHLQQKLLDPDRLVAIAEKSVLKA